MVDYRIYAPLVKPKKIKTLKQEITITRGVKTISLINPPLSYKMRKSSSNALSLKLML